MSKIISFIVAFIASFGLYPQTFIITDIDQNSDVVTVTSANGNAYSFYGCEDWYPGDVLSAIMFDNGTPNVKDDRILSMRYSGTKDMLPEVFPHHEDFERDFAKDFPGMGFDLYPEDDVTAELLERRKNWDFYVVEVCTGTVVDEDGGGRTDNDAPYNYISYARVGFEYTVGTRIVTYLVYDLHSGYVDDIIARYDFRLES